jgi:hypothetical protein
MSPQVALLLLVIFWLALAGKAECGKSPDGKHEEETSEVEVIRKGKKVVILAAVCRWCGKILSGK